MFDLFTEETFLRGVLYSSAGSEMRHVLEWSPFESRALMFFTAVKFYMIVGNSYELWLPRPTSTGDIFSTVLVNAFALFWKLGPTMIDPIKPHSELRRKLEAVCPGS